MALNLDDNKRPYFKQLNLDETFDEIQNAFNSLETSVPGPTSDVTVNTLTTTATASVGGLVISNTASVANDTSTTINVLTLDNNGKVNKKAQNNKKVYRALITQTGTSAPVATVLENTFSGTITWARVNVGNYTATLTGAFTADKTIVNGQTKFTGNATCLGVLGDLGGNLWYTYFDMFEEPDKVNFYLYPSNFSGNVELSTVMGTSPLYIEIITFS